MTPARYSIAIVMLLAATTAPARNVDLSTVPARDGVQLTIYNSEDITLVKETRTVTFKKGANPLQFSWANTLIDPTSVHLTFLTRAADLEIADTTFPHDKPQLLYWTVNSAFDGEAKVQIQYFTSGITWAADYQLVADADEKNAKFEGFVRVTNNSGEDYEGAQVRLVVGKINLVQKIAELARIAVDEVQKLGDKDMRKYKNDALKSELEAPARGMTQPATAAPLVVPQEKAVAKESLSEYFLYTIEGTETIPTGWSKRMRSLKDVTVPLKIQYRYRPAEYGDQLVRLYLLTNDTDGKLGTTPLPDGTWRIFRDNGRSGLSFLAGVDLKYVPIGDKVELNLGPDRNVLFELIPLRAWRDEIWLRLDGTDVFRRVGGPAAIAVRSSVVGCDDHRLYTQRIRNYTPKPIDVEIRRTFPGHATFRSALAPTLHDFQTVQFTTQLEPGQTRDLAFELVTRQGHDAKQNNVTLDQADVRP